MLAAVLASCATPGPPYNTGGNRGGGSDAGGAGGDDLGGGGGAGGASTTADSVWSTLSVLAIVDPTDHGAAGDGVSDDLDALVASVDALPDVGGIVYLPPGASFLKTDVWEIEKSHVKLWAPDRQAEIFGRIDGELRHQSILCRSNVGCGFFGVKLRSDAVERFDALEDNQISADNGSLVEVVGCEIDGSAAAGVFLYGSTEHYIEGNYIHHTWADHVHHTNGATASWVWGNYILNEAPSDGDDGVACVTYGVSSPRCGDMEWWQNTILHGGWGRGYSVIGGDDIHIHDNWAIGTAGAGIIVASEGSYDSASSQHIQIARNAVYQCSHAIGHPGILISGLNAAAEPLDDIELVDNVSADNVLGGAYNAEGEYTNVTNTGLSTSVDDLPSLIPTAGDIQLADTSILRTRDVSHVEAGFRAGLYRIHVRVSPADSGFEQRFEYLVSGSAAAVSSFVAERTEAGDYLSEQAYAGGSTYALLLTSAPIAIPSDLAGVSFRDLRAGDLGGELASLWERTDSGVY